MRSRGRHVGLRESWARAFSGRNRAALEAHLPGFLAGRRWFGGKARPIRRATVLDVVRLPSSHGGAFVTLVRVMYSEGPAETYALVLGCALRGDAADLRRARAHDVVSGVTVGDAHGILYEALGERGPSSALLAAIARRSVLAGTRGELVGVRGRAFRRVRGTGPLNPRLLGAEQSNTSVAFGERFVLKILRRVEPGSNPELEVGRLLTDSARFAHVPAVAGSLEYRPRRGAAAALGILQAWVPNRGDAWTYTLAALARYYERLRSRPAAPAPRARSPVGPYLSDARLLGRRTGELHLALAGVREAACAPEAFTPSYRRAFGRSLSTAAERHLSLLRRRLSALPGGTRAAAAELVERRDELLERCHLVATQKFDGLRTRVHGDYHLGQVLRIARGFVIIDFEGEPAAPLSARRTKHSPLKDVAGMVRSFHYAAYHGLGRVEARDGRRPARTVPKSWAEEWYGRVRVAFVDEYLATVNGASFLPSDRKDVDALLAMYLLEKAIYELGYELNNRPEWVHLPLAGLHQLLADSR